MADIFYIDNRRRYNRPQGMLWSENPGVPSDFLYLPDGLEVGQDPGLETDPEKLNNFMILSDDNRSPISFDFDRIEKRERMINGRMRSYHIADKVVISTSWQMLPSRAYANADPRFNADGTSINARDNTLEFTTDGGAGGSDILKWYEEHTGSFWVYLAYDKRNNLTSNDAQRLKAYTEVIEMFISNFTYSVEKRNNGYDFWNISVTLEEV
jgi:hypothetical protein